MLLKTFIDSFLWDMASTQLEVIQLLWFISLNLLAAIYSLSTIGGKHLPGHSTLNLPTLLPDGTWAKPDSNPLCAEPSFFPQNAPVEFTPDSYIAANPLQLSLFSEPMQPYTPDLLIYDLGHFHYLTCFVNIKYYGHTSNSDLPLNSSNSCTLLSHTMNITYLNHTQYS